MRLKLPLILIITLQCIIPIEAQKKFIESLWQDQDVQSPPLTKFQEKKGILHLISNDAEYLYVNLVIPGTDEQKKILLFGMTLWVDQKIKSKKDIGIMYPYISKDNRTRPEGPAPERNTPNPSSQSVVRENQNSRRMGLASFDEAKYNLVKRPWLIGLVNYTDTAELILIPSNDQQEISGWMGYDPLNFLHYLVAIPLEKIPPNNNESESGFNIRLETGSASPPQGMTGQGGGSRPGGGIGRPGGGGRGGGGGGGRGGGGRSGGMSGGQRPPEMDQIQAISTPTKIKLKNIRLAEK
jgi:hypothetical protein